MLTHKPSEPCGCEGFTTIRCQCKCHIAKSNVKILKEQMKKTKRK